MEPKYLEIANSPTLFIIALIPILFAVVQSILFIRLGRKEADNLDFPEGMVKKVITNSAVFSILPSLPIVITLAILMAVLGKYIPWLRLSVLGSAAYESFAADLTIKAFGLSGLGEANLSPEIFTSVVFVMSLTILVSPIICTIFLKRYDKKLKSIKKSGGFLAAAVGALFIGMLSILFVPELVNFGNHLGIVAAVVAGGSALLMDYISKKTKKQTLSQFSFPLSIIIGMGAAMLANSLF